MTPIPAWCYKRLVAVKRVRTSVHLDEDAFLAEISRAYYEDGLNQSAIAERFGISRSQISRYLQRAKDRGIVQVRVIPPEARANDLENALRQAFDHLVDVRVAQVFSANGQAVRHAVARLGARLIEQLPQPAHTICFGAGRTLASAVELMREVPNTAPVVVQAMGNSGHQALDIDYDAIASQAARAFGARAMRINAPAILGPGLRAADLEASNAQIHAALEAARNADAYVLGIGSLSDDELYVSTGLVETAELADLREAGAVGDMCGRFFDRDGNECESPYSERVVAIGLEDLRRAKTSIAMACGPQKVAAIGGALRGKLINRLVTDEETARSVLEDI